MTGPRIMVTGSRDWAVIGWTQKRGLWWPEFDSDRLLEIGTGLQLAQVLTEMDGHADTPTLVSGRCPDGADRLAETWARTQAWCLELHPAQWARWGKVAGPIRNGEMVDSKPDVVVAFHRAHSRGTADAVAKAEGAGIPVIKFTDNTYAPTRPA